MERRKDKTPIRLVCFAVLAALCIALASFILTPKWSVEFRSGTNARGFYKMPRQSVDVLLLGSSHIVSGVDPNLMYEQYGLSAYCCGTEAQPMLGSYTWLREALRYQDIRAVVLDVQELFLDGNEVNYRKSLDYMRLSPVKWQALRAYRQINPSMNFLSYLLPLVQYHGRYTELTEVDFTGDRSDAYRGYLIETKKRGVDFTGIDPSQDAEPADIRPENLAYFRALCELCRSEDIALVLVITPDISFTAGMHAAVQALADEYSLPFYDFNVTADWPDFDYAEYMSDFRHVNCFGAAVITPLITDRLLSMTELPDRRGFDGFDAMDAAYQTAMSEALAAPQEQSVVPVGGAA